MSGPDQPMYQPPSAPPADQQAPPAPQTGTPGSATASLVMGILGLVICSPIFSPLAIIYGNKAKNEIRTSPGATGESLAKAGVILGYIGLVLLVIGILLIVAGVIAI